MRRLWVPFYRQSLSQIRDSSNDRADQRLAGSEISRSKHTWESGCDQPLIAASWYTFTGHLIDEPLRSLEKSRKIGLAARIIPWNTFFA